MEGIENGAVFKIPRYPCLTSTMSNVSYLSQNLCKFIIRQRDEYAHLVRGIVLPGNDGVGAHLE